MTSDDVVRRQVDPLELVWRALADPTRRAILDRLRSRPHGTGELAAAFPLSRFAVMKHLDVLVTAGLVLVRRSGRERFNHLNPVPLQQLYERWVRPYEAHWASPLVTLRDLIETSPHPETDEMTSTPAPRAPQTAGMLTLTMEIPIAASAERVWNALTTQVASWWPRDFLVTGQPMTFEATLGGRLFEQDTNGAGVTWYTVYAIVPGESIDLVGHLSPSFGGPTQSLLHLALRDEGHRVVLELTDALVGNVGPTSEASVGDGWRTIFDTGLRQFVEGQRA